MSSEPAIDERNYEVVVDADELDRIVEVLLAEPRYAIDTEFHRERTYFPRLALVQIGWSDGLVLLDPLELDLSPLAAVFDSDVLAVVHACSQDLEVLERATGTIPNRIFDTQIAAAFVGMRSPSLAALHDLLLGIRLPKADRLTDWLARPLEQRQLRYAASDVDRLLDIHDELVRRLEASDRLGWAENENELARTRSQTVRDPLNAWRRIKEARSLRGRSQAVVREIAAWRERRAMRIDQPARYVIPDLAVVAMAQRPPKKTADFGRIRGLDERHLKAADKEALLDVIKTGINAPRPKAEPARSRSDDRDLRPAVTLVAAWLGQFAGDLELDPAMVGSRADIEAFLRGEDEARLAHGWRHDLVGMPIKQLLEGNVALAFDGKGRLLLEHRSHQPLDGVV